MTKIYAINGSPSNSANTATILEHALHGAAEAGADSPLQTYFFRLQKLFRL